jgi:mannitol/fructose-specific phosphotransferase system IIA component (Ntr-type)
MPGGIALPHAKTDGTDRLIAAVGISKEGTVSPCNPEEKTHVYLLSLCPKHSDNPYLQFVAHAAKILSVKENVNAMMNATTPEAVRDIFTENK